MDNMVERMQEIADVVSTWPEGKLREKAMYCLKTGKIEFLKGILKNPPGSEVKMADGTIYIVDRNGTWIKKR